MPVARGVAIPLAEVEMRASRSSGPGGQHANVTASRIEAVFDVAASRALTEEQKRRVMARAGPRLVAVAQDARLRARLAAALAVQRRRRATRPTRVSRERRLEAKRRRGQLKRSRRREWD